MKIRSRQTGSILRYTLRVKLNMLLTLAAAGLLLHPLQSRAQSVAELQAGFLNPPDSAKPMVRWWWFGPAVVKPEILRELQQMKADGIGGAELAFVYPIVLDDAEKGLKNLSFLSPEMLDAVAYAQAEGRRLGLRMDVTLCSGWPYGGPATPLAEAAARLRTAEVAVPAGATSVAAPTLNEGEALLSAALVEGTPSKPVERGSTVPRVPSWSAATAKPLAGSTFDPAGVPRVALFFILSHTKQQVKRAAVGAEGYVLDPFSHDAVATHLRAVGEPLVKAFGATPPYAIFSDSLEAYGADWTPKLPAEFLRRRGYDLLPHLPELVAGGTPAAERVRHDYGRTLTELVNENYLVQIDDWARAHGTRFRSQTYGEPAVSFSSQRLVDLIEGEGPQWRAFSTLRWASSASHVFDHTVTSGETFTWLHSPVFRATPLDMKAEADIDFIMGENQLSFHGWPYSPPASQLQPGDPGWSLYAAAVFNDHNPWHPVMPAVDAYITRLSWLLQQGKPANQVAVLLPTDDAWANFSPGKVTITTAMRTLVSPGLMSTILAAGYNVDLIDADAIERVGLGTHQVLVLPPTDRIPTTTLGRIASFKQAGGKVIVVGHAPTIDAEGNALPEPKERLGEIVSGEAELAQALRAAAAPDLNLADATVRDQVGFIRRKAEGADIYFIVNTGNTAIHTRVSLAASAGSAKFGERLDPETGGAKGYLPASEVPLDLAPYGSTVLLFGDLGGGVPGGSNQRRIQFPDLSGGWKLSFTDSGKVLEEPTLRDWAGDPDTRHYSGEVVYSRDIQLGSTANLSPVFLQVAGGSALPGAPITLPQENANRGADGMPNPLVTSTGPGMHAYYDPPIREAALVYVNGQAAGALWHPPYRLDVTKLLKQGVNHLEIRVYNTAMNAWSGIPPRDYGPLKAKYGDRFQMQDLDKVQALPSGILRRIELVQESEQ